MSCSPKVSLCDAMICVVASDFFVASRRPMCGHTPLLIILYALDVMLQKSSNGQHRHAAVVGKHTWLELPYPKFLQMTLSDCDEGAVVRLALPTVCSVSLTASVCQVFGNDCIEFDYGDHPPCFHFSELIVEDTSFVTRSAYSRFSQVGCTCCHI